MDYRGRAEKAEAPTEELVPVYDFGPSAGQDAPHGDAIASCNIAFSQAFLRQMTAAKASDLAIVRVKGSSMEPTLMDGDMALVDFTKVNLSLDGLFVLRFDDELHVKRIGRSATRGNVMVISDHPSYPALDMSAPDLSVIGCVLWVGRKI